MSMVIASRCVSEIVLVRKPQYLMTMALPFMRDGGIIEHMLGEAARFVGHVERPMKNESLWETE